MRAQPPGPDAAARTGNPTIHAPEAEGERLAAWYRLALAGILMAFIVGYRPALSFALSHSLLRIAALTTAWSLVSVAVLAVHGRGLFRPWHSYLTIGLDLAVVTAMRATFVPMLPLGFAYGPLSGLYFVVIGLAAFRGSRRLAITAGIAAAAIHLATSATWFLRALPGNNVVVLVEGHAMGLNLLDELGKSLAMATVGVVIGFVTASLRASERRYLHLFDNLPDGALIVDEQGRLRLANQRLADMAGTRRDSLPGRPLDTVLRRGPDSGSPSLLLCADGAEVPVRTADQPISYRGDPCLEISVRDVTEQVRLEHQLFRSQRMESIGQIAGGLAHDFNNLLGGIIGAASLAARTADRIENSELGRRLRGRVDLVRQRGEAARDVVRGLLHFSRRSSIGSAPVDLARVARETAEICRSTFREDIDLAVDVPEGEATVEGDAGALAQALMNLCINAQDAMPGGGTIGIRLAEARQWIGDGGEESGSLWRLEVRDTGVGMDPATRERIFDPFFSTKPHATGTGLGLSMVDRIAHEHGGFVEVETAPGRGSTFALVLPGSRLSLLPDPPGEAPPSGTGRILYVDDDDIVRSTVTAMLTELGYEVAAAASGEEGARLFESRGGAFDLLILDLMMPGLDGIQTLERIRGIDRSIPAVIATGFWSADRSAEIEELDVAAVLRKPFPLSTLAHELARILGGGGG